MRTSAGLASEPGSLLTGADAHGTCFGCGESVTESLTESVTESVDKSVTESVIESVTESATKSVTELNLKLKSET